MIQRTTLFTLLLCANALAAAPARADADVSLVELPSAQMAALDESARARLQRAIDYFEARRTSLSGRDLGLAYGRLALHFLAQGQFAPAMASFENASRLDDENYRWPYYLGLAHAFQGDGDRAIAQYGRSLQLYPDNAAAATRLGLALIDAGRSASARSLLEGVIEDEQRPHAAALAGLGRLAFERGDYAEAIRQYEKALSQQPDAGALHAVLSRAYENLGDQESAQRHAGRDGSALPVIEDPLVALLDAHRQPSSRFIELGDRARDRGQVAQAAVFYDFAAAVNPEDPDAGERIAALKRARPEAATAADFFERGVYFAASGDDASAIREYEAAIERDPQDAATRLFLANAHMRQQQFALAAAQYARAAARDDKNAELRFREGVAWMAGGDCDKAESALLAGYELEPTALRIVQAIARLYATCPVGQQKREQALKYAQMLYNGQPALETSATLAMVLAANGRFEDAADYQRQAIFEALKSGRAESDPSLGQNLERYVKQQASERAWPLDHPIYQPPRPKPRG